MKTKLNFSSASVFISKLKFKLLILLMISNSCFTFSQTCNANLEVSKNRNVRSTASTGTYYKMTLTNNGPNDVFTLSSLNTNTICTNSDGSSTTTNVALNVTFEDLTFNTINSISVNSGETINFLVHITVPSGTPINRWCCNQVTASSNLCSNYKINTTLHTLVINSNDD